MARKSIQKQEMNCEQTEIYNVTFNWAIGSKKAEFGKKKRLNNRQKCYCTCDCSFRKSGSWNSPLKTWERRGPGLELQKLIESA